ncbi:hypothetical protein A3A46_02170 [Candidatus Roizmanbacteria bacterium RIFCSPLOWO2_01_FULL_37_13]|uniref:Uncharacterized protein n=1 Tax=Candidatus Roizmanbacteria bacterium RIFCSPHIGHO2_02_FULL_38_11 TaxID=1802039 RepID=A0A1F7GXB7_9BACT|nr:MAG: hypothetical protein A3C25_00855 [Candidatus Roizmanbacteria bacterium RIFCSPHIGHO2_02_FULL_38_11]OGK33482.1 MAG: hypothetical protein A3F58_00810 [Candidatus Roizmanbacteria bacterium RIFCSPHIGHO2_12_FULL_37_9b]OGK42891.1 MAG: hypothetical protein A3A46_02170 [Candidatus Roizmanbacteria bacterium RIFCSPLOWO2_01_FULL_37_13]
MDFNQFIISISGQDIFSFFFKTFAVVFSLLYIIYALVIFKQTQVMTRTLETEATTLILLISLIQIVVGIGLLFISLLLL